MCCRQASGGMVKLRGNITGQVTTGSELVYSMAKKQSFQATSTVSYTREISFCIY